MCICLRAEKAALVVPGAVDGGWRCLTAAWVCICQPGVERAGEAALVQCIATGAPAAGELGAAELGKPPAAQVQHQPKAAA